MSTKTKQNVMATALIALMLVLGGLFGYVFLGGSNANDADATTPKNDTACMLCVTDSRHGTGGNTPSLLTTNKTSGGGGNR